MERHHIDHAASGMSMMLGHAGLAFPNCLGNLNVTVSGSGAPPPTGDVTLSLTGGIYGTSSAVLGTVGVRPCTMRLQR